MHGLIAASKEVSCIFAWADDGVYKQKFSINLEYLKMGSKARKSMICN